MKRSELRQIIKEEIQKIVLNEISDEERFLYQKYGISSRKAGKGWKISYVGNPPMTDEKFANLNKAMKMKNIYYPHEFRKIYGDFVIDFDKKGSFSQEQFEEFVKLLKKL